jgi:predicted outer membrane repeat protein
VSVAISGVTITDGKENGSGGGIENEGTLTVSNSSVSGNTAVFGGGISQEPLAGTLTLTNTTVSGNHATFGGGIEADGPVTLNNSTVSGNTAERFGGGIFESEGFMPSEEVTLNSSTVSGNSPDECAPQRLAKKVC